MSRQKLLLVFPVVFATALVGCGGDGGGTTNAANGTGTRSIGAVTRSGNDIYVNGTLYDTTGATVTIDGQAADASALQTGMIVTVDGTASADGTSASHIEYDHELKGEIDSKTADSLVVLGQTVRVDGNTQYRGVASLADLAVGDRVEVSGYIGANGTVHASYIERESGTGNDSEDVEGTISELTPTTFRLNGLLVDYQNAQVSGQLANGTYVEVEGDAAAGANVMTATRVEVEEPDDESAGHSGEMELEGYVTKITGADTFEVNGQPIKVDAQTVYEAGTNFSDVLLDAKIEVEGWVDADGVLLAREVSFE